MVAFANGTPSVTSFQDAMLTGRAFAAPCIGFRRTLLPDFWYRIKHAPGPLYLVVMQKERAIAAHHIAQELLIGAIGVVVLLQRRRKY